MDLPITPDPDWYEKLPRASPQLISKVLDDLGLINSAERNRLGTHLGALTLSYSVGRYLERLFGTRHDVRVAMRKVSRQTSDILTALDRLPPEYALGMTISFKEAPGLTPDFVTFTSGLKHLDTVCRRLSQIDLSKKQPNDVLKQAVGGLMLVLEKATGNRATVRRRRDGHDPELSSPEARAIGQLLRCVHPILLTTTLVNTIVAIRREHRGRPLETYAPMLLIGRSFTAF